MDNLFRHTLPLERHFPQACRLNSFGAYGTKKNVIDHSFSSLNFSLILSGDGFYYYRGKEYKVQAPCLMMQYPGVHQIYGPHTSWEEYYFIFPAETERIMEERNFAHRDMPIRDIRKTAKLLKLIEEIYKLCQQQKPSGDEIDLMAQQILLEALSSCKREEQESKIHQLRNYIEMNFRRPINFAQVAKDFSFSPSTMHREWKKLNLPSPQNYQNKLRMEQACRLLAEENLHIQDIAYRLGFDDPLYFSRNFKKFTHLSPRKYRQVHANKIIESPKTD